MLSRRELLSAGAAYCATALPCPSLLASSGCGCNKVTYRDGSIRLCDGRRLSYREYGEFADGPLVFYFHGTPGSRLELALCDIESCNSGVRVVAVDRPGMGCSSYDANRCITDWPCDIEQLACALGHADKPFGIVGLSGGAPYAAACARYIPHRLTHVAIVSGHTPLEACGVCPGNQDKQIELVARLPHVGKLVFGAIDRRLDRKPDKVVQMVSKNWSAADRRLMLCDCRNYRKLIANMREALRCGTDGLVRDIELLAGCWGFRLCDIQGVPVSIWQGGCDPVVTPSMGRYFHRHIAGSELIVDPKAGHATMFKWHAQEILARFLS